MQFERLGPYRLGRQLGQGGMGVVFEGFDDESGQTAAIKVLNPQLAKEEGFRERFEIEIETLKRLKHPNIVRLYGFGEQEDRLYYSMELIEGTNLETELKGGRRFTWQEVIQLAIPLCRALKLAHDHGIFHRDLKPANLLLTASGEIKLADFGIARLFGANSGDGRVVGTAAYMSPEQVEGRMVTHHCDLYSLGGVLFAMLAGRPPFRSPSLPELLEMQRLAPPPPVSQFAPGVPLELERIITRLLSKDPQQRFPSAMVLARQFAALEQDLLHQMKIAELRAQAQSALAAPADEFDLAGDEDDASPPPSNETRIRPQIMDLPADAAPIKVVNATMDFDAQGLSATDEHEFEIVSDPQARQAGKKFFTTVEEDERQRRRTEAEEQREGIPGLVQVLILATSLMLVGLGIWHFVQPPSADKLSDRIEAAAALNDPEQLLGVADAIDDFLARFPEDPRGKALEKYREEIELLRLERRFRRLNLTRDSLLLPIQRDYIEAVNYLSLDPQRSLAKLEALVAFYGNSESDSATLPTLQLARRQIARLREQVAQQTPAYLVLIDAQLQRAAALGSSDPAQARAIYRSILDLYGDRPWASDRVLQAQSALDALPIPK